MGTVEHPFVTPYSGEFEKTYIFTEWAHDVIPYARHYFQTIPFQDGIPQNDITPLWVTFLILACLSAIAFVKSFYNKRYNLLVRTTFNWKISKQIIRYEKVYTHPVNIILIGIFLLCTPTFFAIAYKNVAHSSYSLLILSLWFCIPLLSYLLVKLLMHKFFAWLFNIHESMEEYIFQSSLFNKLFGIFNLTFLILLLFSNMDSILLISSSLIILILLLVLQLIRGVLIGIQKGISSFSIILYLCTLEIFPWIIMGKMIKDQL